MHLSDCTLQPRKLKDLLGGGCFVLVNDPDRLYKKDQDGNVFLIYSINAPYERLKVPVNLYDDSLVLEVTYFKYLAQNLWNKWDNLLEDQDGD